MVARLTQEIPALLFHALPCLALLSWLSGVWPQARCADPRGRAAWECAGNSIIPALLCSVIQGISSKPDWHYLPISRDRGRKMLLVTFAV